MLLGRLLFLSLALSFGLGVAGCVRELVERSASDAGDGSLEAAPRFWSWPADGESAVPLELERLLLGSELALEAELRIEASSARSIALEAVPMNCGGLFPEARFCYALQGDLARLGSGPAALRLGGETIASMIFVTEVSEDEARTLDLLPIECGVFEEHLGELCLERDDRSAILRGRLNRSARAEIIEDGEISLESLAPGGGFELSLDLRGRCERNLELVFIDLSGAERSVALRLEPHRDLPELHLIESLADPYGPEPAQEYLILYHAGDVPISLDGYRLSDSPFRSGDPFPQGASIAPRARALLVGEHYDPAYPGEPAPPPAAALIRFEGSLTTNGLSNQGEPLYLIDAYGRRVSAMPRFPTKEGSCLIARSIENRLADPSRFFMGECRAGRERQ